MLDKPETMVGSGLWLAQPLIYRAVEISGPYSKPSAPIEVADRVEGAEVASFVTRMTQQTSVFALRNKVLNAYAAEILRVARIVKEGAYEVILCPLRGARHPGIQADLICQTESFQPFDGTDLAKRTNDERIEADLHRLILDKPMTGDTRKIGILDTAIGGDSCKEFSRLLRKLNDKTCEPWDVHFHLIHDHVRPPNRASQAFSYRSDRLQIDITLHPIVSLLFEDKEAALGYSVHRGGGESRIVRLQQDGQVLLHGPEQALLYRPGPLDETLLSLVGNEIVKQIQTLPDVHPVDLDYWSTGTR